MAVQFPILKNRGNAAPLGYDGDKEPGKDGKSKEKKS